MVKNSLHRNRWRTILAAVVAMLLFTSLLPVSAFASDIDTPPDYSYTDETGTHNYWFGGTSTNGDNVLWAEEHFYSQGTGSADSGDGGASSTTGNSGYWGSVNGASKSYKDISNKIVSLCNDYNAIGNQISWMKSLNFAAGQEFVAGLGLGDTLLLAVLKHEDINSSLMASSFSMGNINHVIAGRIHEQAEGYTSIDAIAKATGLSADKVSEILKQIAAGNITEETIKLGKNTSQSTNRGPYLRARALEQEKVYAFLKGEIERMTGDESSLSVLYKDLG